MSTATIQQIRNGIISGVLGFVSIDSFHNDQLLRPSAGGQQVTGPSLKGLRGGDRLAKGGWR